MMICLSGQHEMVEDFTGFRNFFTLNFIAKPIYNAYVLSSRLGDELLEYNSDNDKVFVTATRKENGYSLLLTYCDDLFGEEIPAIEENLRFSEDISGKHVTVYRIDRETTNPYRLCQRLGISDPTAEDIAMLREEGRLKAISEFISDGETVTLSLTANCTYFIEIY